METIAVLLLGISLAVTGFPVQPSPPHLPVFSEWDVTPGESDSLYGKQWTMGEETTPVYDTWKESRHTTGTLNKGDKVLTLTGVVITYKPGRARMDRDLPDRNLKKGDIILTYTYRGEGFYDAFVNGVFYRGFDCTFTKRPDGQGCLGDYCAATFLDLGKKTWWIKVKLPKSGVGWIASKQADGGPIN